MPNESEIDEDAIIGSAFSILRKGIIDLDWEAVCLAYEMVSGEKLEPKLPSKSRLEKIRENIKSPTNDKKPPTKRRKKGVVAGEHADKDLKPLPLVEEKFQGGRKFAKDGFIVIATELDDEEKKQNKKRNKKVKMPDRHKNARIDDITATGEDGVGFMYDQSKIPPPPSRR